MATIHRSQPGTSGTTKLNHQTNEAWFPVQQRQLILPRPWVQLLAYLRGVLCSKLVLLLGDMELVLKHIKASFFVSYSTNINVVFCGCGL
jgi:hypothetical protein